MTELMSSFQFLFILVMYSEVSCESVTPPKFSTIASFLNGKIVVDISSHFLDTSLSNNWETKRLERDISITENMTGAMFYYDTDLNRETIAKLNAVTNWIDGLEKIRVDKIPVELLVTLRYKENEENNYAPWLNRKITIPKFSLPVLRQLDSLSLNTKVAFENTQTNYTCVINNPEKTEQRFPFFTLEIEDFTAMFQECKNCTGNLKLGYAVDENFFKCTDFVENTHAHFFLAKLNFSLNANFVESYGVFERSMNSFVHLSKTHVLQMGRGNIPIYYHARYQYNIDSLELEDSAAHIIPPEAMNSTKNFLKAKNDHVIKLVVAHQRRNMHYLKVDTKYKCLFRKFVQEWVSKSNITVILQAEGNVTENCWLGQLSKYESLIIPEPADIRTNLDIYNQSMLATISCSGLRSIQTNLNDLRQHGFHSVQMFSDLWETWIRHMNGADQKCIEKIKTNTKLLQRGGREFIIKANIFVPTAETVVSGSFQKDKLHPDITSVLGVRADKFIISLDRLEPSFRHSVMPRNPTPFSCVKDLGYIAEVSSPKSRMEGYSQLIDIVENDRNFTDFMELCDDIVLSFDLSLEREGDRLNSTSILKDDRINYLKRMFHLAESILKLRWPNKKVILVLFSASPTDVREGSMHCSPKFAALTEYYEAIFSWAEIYQFHVAAHTRSYSSPVFWSELNLNAEVIPVDASGNDGIYPVYIRRAYNQSMAFGEWTNGMYPCLEWLHQVSPTEIGFSRNYNVGAYFHWHLKGKNGTLMKSEISILLLFAMAHFHMIEIEISDLQHIALTLSVLKTPEFKEMLLENAILERKIYFSVPLSNNILYQHNIIEAIENVPNEISLRFHFSKYSPVKQKDISVVMNQVSRQWTNFSRTEWGVEINNCAEIVSQLILTEGTSDSGTTLNTSSYIVCTITGRSETGPSKGIMQKFLETHFYIKKVLQYFHPNLKQVYFKMHPITVKSSEETEQLIILLNQMSDFSNGYDISYFLLPAFSSEIGKDQGWWKISNYTDFSNPLIYQDIQSTYLGIEQSRPTMPKPETSEELTTNWTVWIVYSLLLAMALLISILAAVVIVARRNAKLLSDAEVQAFIQGRESAKNASDDFNEHLVTGKYNKEFEISKEDIFLEPNNILGMGHFGIVYKASIRLRHRILESVAVKMPQEGCGKQTFVGMLQEVKLLCFLGNHKHLVRIIGFYTSEIKNGILYIVMEICNGGNLLDHLKQLNLNRENIKQSFITPDLIRFCHEIALGMEYIASKNVIHGDLSARNVLLDGLKVCKISDFGLSRKLYEYNTYTKKTQEPLPWRWMAYEALANLKFSTMSDVWSFGITAWEIFSLGNLPYCGITWSPEFVTELENGMRLTSPTLATTIIFEKMEECWKFKRTDRPNFTELVVFFAELLPYADVN